MDLLAQRNDNDLMPIHRICSYYVKEEVGEEKFKETVSDDDEDVLAIRDRNNTSEMVTQVLSQMFLYESGRQQINTLAKMSIWETDKKIH